MNPMRICSGVGIQYLFSAAAAAAAAALPSAPSASGRFREPPPEKFGRPICRAIVTSSSPSASGALRGLEVQLGGVSWTGDIGERSRQVINGSGSTGRRSFGGPEPFRLVGLGEVGAEEEAIDKMRMGETGEIELAGEYA